MAGCLGLTEFPGCHFAINCKVEYLAFNRDVYMGNCYLHRTGMFFHS